MTMKDALDRYHLARARGWLDEQDEIANLLVDELVPELIERLAEVTIERNKAWDDRGTMYIPT